MFLALALLTDKMDPMYIIPKWLSEFHNDTLVKKLLGFLRNWQKNSFLSAVSQHPESESVPIGVGGSDRIATSLNRFMEEIGWPLFSVKQKKKKIPQQKIFIKCNKIVQILRKSLSNYFFSDLIRRSKGFYLHLCDHKQELVRKCKLIYHYYCNTQIIFGFTICFFLPPPPSIHCLHNRHHCVDNN